MLYLTGNQLTGPAFPAAWIAPDAPMNVRILVLNDNHRLTGTLPEHLPWSSPIEL